MTREEQEKAIAAAKAAIDRDPTNSQNHVELGMAYFHADRFDEAMSAFRQAVALNPNEATAYNGMGRLYYHTGPAQAAIEAYQRAIALDHHYVDAYYGLGILYSAQLGDYPAAINAFQEGIDHNPTEAFLVASLGSTYARMGQFEQAIAALKRAISMQPDNTFAYGWLSIIHLYQGKYDEAITACQREIEIEDNNSAHRVLGYIYDCLGQQEESTKQLEKAVAMEPDDYEARGALARVYRAGGRLSDADEQYEIANRMASQDDEYGQACFEAVTGNAEGAVKLLEIALRKGQVQLGWARIDPEFVFLKEYPGFKELLER
jgi:superkiller protein 3